MKKVLTLFKIELFKLKHQRFPFIAFFFLLLFTVASALLRNQLSDVKGMGMGSANGWQIMTFAASWGIQMATLLILILSINLIADEFSERTIKNLLTKPILRSQFILGKAGTIIFLSFIFILAIFLTSFIMGAVSGELGNLQERGYVLVKWQRLLWHLFLAFCFSILTVSIIGFFGAFIAVLLPRSGVAIGASLILYFALNIISQFDQFRHFLFTSFTYFPINTAKEIAHGLASPWTPQLYWCLLTHFIYGAIFIFLAIKLFNRKDILS